MLYMYRQKWQCNVKMPVVLPTGCPCSVGVIAGICWMQSQKSPLFPRAGGGGCVVTNDWCIR